MKKLAIVTTHPIQYYAPVFALLHQRQKIQIQVYYTAGQMAHQYDPGFSQSVDWDLPLLEGYDHQFLTNTSRQPGSHHFSGAVNPDIVDVITTWQPDAILVIGWAYQSHLKILRYFKNKIPVLFRGDSTLLDEQSGIKNLMRSLALTWIYKHIDYALYPGTNTKKYFSKYGLKPSQLVFAPHAVDNERFAIERPDEVQKLRSGLQIKETDILIAYCGKFEEKKDPHILLDAFLQLNKQDCHLLFAGTGLLEKDLKARAAGNPQIHFIGFQNQMDIPVVYQACDLFCLPSKGPAETWGLAVNEAMACGKAVLVSDKVGCAVDLLKPYQNGHIFKHSDSADLLQHLMELTLSKAVLKQYGDKSAEIIAGWNFTKIASVVENTLLS